MSTSHEIISDIALGLTSILHDKQSAQFQERYKINTIECKNDTSSTSYVLSDILPFHPLFVSSVKLEYVAATKTPSQMDTSSEIRVVVELRSDNLT